MKFLDRYRLDRLSSLNCDRPLHSGIECHLLYVFIVSMHLILGPASLRPLHTGIECHLLYVFIVSMHLILGPASLNMNCSLF